MPHDVILSIGDAFDLCVDFYDSWMRAALPGYGDIFSTAVAMIPFPEDSQIDVLDLGAGTGLFSEHVSARLTQAKFTLVDLAPKMLAAARERFRDKIGQFEFEQQDYRQFKVSKIYDLVISSLSIHHLEDSEKKALFHQIYRWLKIGGVFINVDQIKAPTPELRALYWEEWLRMVREKGAAEEQIQASIQRQREFDRDASLTDQLDWLNEAGFANVDCVYKNTFIGVFYAHKG